MKHIQTIIFDFDGTLADCKELHQRAFRNALNSVCPEVEYTDEEIEGRPTREKIRILHSKGYEFNGDKLNELKQEELESIIILDLSDNAIDFDSIIYRKKVNFLSSSFIFILNNEDNSKSSQLPYINNIVIQIKGVYDGGLNSNGQSGWLNLHTFNIGNNETYNTTNYKEFTINKTDYSTNLNINNLHTNLSLTFQSRETISHDGSYLEPLFLLDFVVCHQSTHRSPSLMKTASPLTINTSINTSLC